MAGEKLIRRALEAIRQPAAAPREGIRAYHSSPHDFDRFDLSKIGTGEGNQAYGHGLYVAESPKVSGQGGDYWRQFWNKMPSGPERSAATALFANKFDRDKAIDHLLRDIEYNSARGVPGKYGNGPDVEEGHRLLAQEGQQALDILKSGQIAGPRTYEVNINARPEQFLDYDRPLAQQSDSVQNALRSIDIADESVWPNISGHDAYEMLRVDSMGDDAFLRDQAYRLARRADAGAGASKILREAGIPGIKYFDAGSRDAGEGTRNYVVFDDRLIDIMKKYGLPMMTAGAGAASMADQPGAAMEAGDMAQPGAEDPRDGFDRGGTVARAIRTVRQMMERSQDLPAEQRMMVVHKTRLPALEQYERLGGLPVPSTAVVKTGEPLTNFGDVTLIGNPEILAKPSERNPIFASDVYSPRMPDIQGDKKQFFETYNRYGEPTRRPATLGSLVSNMRGNVRGGENFGATEGAVRAQITPQFRSVAELDAARGRLSQAAYDEALAAMRGRGDELFARIGELSRNPRDMDFYGDMEGVARILRQYGSQGAEPLAAYMNKRYNMNNDAMADVVRYVRDLRDMPAPYFEGKPQRAVPFTDFSGALIPEGRTARDTADLLNRQGVRNIEFYSPKQDLGGGEAERALSDALIERFPQQQFADGGAVDFNDAPNYALDAETARLNMGNVFAPRTRGLSQGKIPTRAESIPLARPVAPPELDVVDRALDVVRAEPRPMDIKVSRQAPPPPRPVPRPAPRPAPAPAQAVPDTSESRRLWDIYNESGNPADFVRASNAMRDGRAEGGEVREEFDKGGVAKKALDAARRIMGYTDPPTKKIEDWQWRPLSEVDKELGLREIPPHVQQFGDYMREMVDRGRRGEISDRDLIKAYTTTRASIQRRAANTDAVREASGLPLFGAEKKIRPEGAWSEWLMSPAGQKYLDRAVKGEMSEDTVESALSVMRKFGLAPTQIEAMDWAAKNLPGRSQAASDLVYRAGQMDSPVSEWREFTSDVKGVGPAKSGFVASLLGRGDLPTLDARQVILNTGLPTDASQSFMGRSFRGQKSFGAQEGVDRLAARQEALGLEAPSKYDPFYQHLAHHTIWDKASNEKTTHADIINAMRNAAIVLGVPAAGAATMPEDQPVERASGGRLLEDEYPTHYLPNVGRQVMADGGAPDDDIRRYEARMADIARQPEDIRSMTHAPSRPMRPIQIEGGLIGKRTLGEAPYDVAGPLSGIAQTAYSLKTLPFYFTPAAPLAAAADFGEAAIDTAKAAREGDYLGAGITGALGVAMPGYAYRKPIGDVVGRALNFVRGNPGAVGAGAAGAAVMTPEEAEASKSRMVQQVLDIVRGTTPAPSNKDPRFWHNISSTKLSRPLDEMRAGYERVEPEFRAPVRQPSDYEGKALITTFGDPSIGGVRLMSVNDQKLMNPTLMQAGPSFVHGASARGPDRSIWASDLPMVSALANRAAAAQKAGYEPFLNYVKMGGESPDYSHHVTDPLIDLFRQSKVDKGTVADFDRKMREGFNKDFPPYPDWPGLRSRALESYLFETGPAKSRTAMAKLMATGDFQKRGMPDVAAVRFAATDPDLLNVPNYSSGRMIARMDPEATAIRDPAVPHKTYRTQLSASPEGADPARLSGDVPLEISHYDWVQSKLAEKPNMNPSQLQYTYTRSAPTLYMTPETVDRMSTFLDLKKRGLIP